MKKDVCPFCGKKINENEKQCPHCQKKLGMIWYKFIIWVQLIIYLIYFLWLGISYMRGTIYGLNGTVAASIKLYNEYPVLKTIDLIQGLILIIFAISAFYIRKCLVNRKHSAPKNYLIYLIVIFVEPVIYSFIASFVTTSNISGYALSSMYTTFILFIVSMVYFKNRSYYFNK